MAIQIWTCLTRGFLRAFVPDSRLLRHYGVSQDLYFGTFRRIDSHSDEHNVPEDLRWGKFYRQGLLLVPVGCVGSALANVTHKCVVDVRVKLPLFQFDNNKNWTFICDTPLCYTNVMYNCLSVKTQPCFDNIFCVSKRGRCFGLYRGHFQTYTFPKARIEEVNE